MAWQNPKVDWTPVDGVSDTDYNRIEGNIAAIGEYDRSPGFGVTAGSANVYTLALSPAPTSYKAGTLLFIKIHAANTGASSINVNGLGAKTIKNGGTVDVKAGDLPLNQVVPIIYDGTYFQIPGIKDTNLLAANIKAGVTVYGTAGTFTADAAAVASDIISGKSGYVNGTKVAGNIPDRGAGGAVTPGTAAITKLAGRYTSDIVIDGDADLVASNIKNTANIFGVQGNVSPDVLDENWYSKQTGFVSIDATTDLDPYIALSVSGKGILVSSTAMQYSDSGYQIVIDGNLANGEGTFSRRNKNKLYLWKFNTSLVIRQPYGTTPEYYHFYNLD